MLSSPKLAFSVAASAVLADVCKDQIYDAIREGRLRARKAGRRTLILQSDLEDYLSKLPVLELRGAPPRSDLRADDKSSQQPQVSTRRGNGTSR